MILIGIPHTGMIRIELAKWLFDLAKKRKDVDLFFRHQQPVDVNRNEIIHHFLTETKHKWLLMIDSDQIPKTDLTKMIKHNKKVVGGLTTILFKGVPMPLIMKRSPDKSGVFWNRITLEDLKKRGNNKTGLIKVDGLGTGIIMIRRDVLKKMKPPWFNFTMTKEGKLKLSEDYNFCYKLSKLGIPMYLDSNAKAGHAKNIDLFELNKVIGKMVKSMGWKTETIGGKK